MDMMAFISLSDTIYGITEGYKKLFSWEFMFGIKETNSY